MCNKRLLAYLLTYLLITNIVLRYELLNFLEKLKNLLFN